MNSPKKPNPHQGHRQRVREKYLKHGLDVFADHEVLELLLFYCVPYKDTNETAHKLLDSFGSLHALMNADPSDIQRTCGVPETMAVFLTLLPAIFRRYETSKWTKKVTLDSTKKASQFCLSLFAGEKNECLYLVCMDAHMSLIYAELLCRGESNEVFFFPKDVVSVALKHNASAVIITHNHPSGLALPSAEDQRSTQVIVSALETIGVEVLDHIIVAGDKYLSFSEKRLFDFHGK